MPPAPSDEFRPQSHNAMFAKILAEMEADRVTRAEFRAEVKDRFDEGTARMTRIEEQTTKTNGRVTKLETARKLTMAKAAGALLILGSLAWLYERGFRLAPPS